MKHYAFEIKDHIVILNEKLNIISIESKYELKFKEELVEVPEVLKERVVEKLWEKENFEKMKNFLLSIYEEKVKDKGEREEFFAIKLFKEVKVLKKIIKILEEEIEKSKRFDLGTLDALEESLKIVKKSKENVERKLEKYVKELFPNLFEVCGLYCLCELLEHVKSLRKIAFATTQQIIAWGMEKKVFNNMKRGEKSQAIGIVGKYVEGKNKKEKLKNAKKLALKISIAARKDYFGEDGN